MRSRRGSRGFTLLEVLIAFVILSLSLTALFRLFSTNLGNLGAAEDRIVATQLAQSLLSRMGVDQALEAGRRNGDVGGGMRWVMDVNPVGDRTGGPEELNQQLYRVTVVVAWPGRTGEKSVALTSLRLRAEGEP